VNPGPSPFTSAENLILPVPILENRTSNYILLGILLRDLRSQVSPTAELVGVDFMPSFVQAARRAATAEQNIEFITGDVCQSFPPDLQSRFDMTHVRYLMAVSGKVGLTTAVKNLAETVAPGGWLQIREQDFQEDMPGYTPAIRDLASVARAMFACLGHSAGNFSPGLSEAFREAGLENVSVQQWEMPVGKKLDPSGGEVAKSSIEPFKFTIPTILGTAKREFSRL